MLGSEIDELCDEVVSLLTFSPYSFEAIMYFPVTDTNVKEDSYVPLWKLCHAPGVPPPVTLSNPRGNILEVFPLLLLE